MSCSDKFDPDKSQQEAPPPSGPTSVVFLAEPTGAHVSGGSDACLLSDVDPNEDAF